MYRPFNGVPRADHFCLTCLSCLCMCVYLSMCLRSIAASPNLPFPTNNPSQRAAGHTNGCSKTLANCNKEPSGTAFTPPTPSSSSTPSHTHPNTSSGTLKGSPMAAAKSLSTVEGAEVDLSMKSVGLPAASPQ